MKRSAIKHRPRRNRPPVDWGALTPRVVERDLETVRKTMIERGVPGAKLIQISGTRVGSVKGLFTGRFPCPAWVMDPDASPCAGSWKLDHVKEELRLGVKAEDDIDHLIALCAVHDERGMRAGYQWNTAHRDEQREYLAARRAERDSGEAVGQ